MSHNVPGIIGRMVYVAEERKVYGVARDDTRVCATGICALISQSYRESWRATENMTPIF